MTEFNHNTGSGSQKPAQQGIDGCKANVEHPVLSWMTLPSIPSSLRSDQGVPDWPFLWAYFMKRAKTKLVRGVGINDADYSVYVYEQEGNGQNVKWQCPFYRTWTSMLKRCYGPHYLAIRPTYSDCLVTDEWLLFSKFRQWMDSQNHSGMQLDKDILIPGNKIYSPELCVFVPSKLNGFLLDRAAARGEWPIGVNFHKQSGKFRAVCSNPFTGKGEFLGRFTCPDAAHEAWRRRKHEHACRYAGMQTDPRIAQALRTRYATPAGESK